MTPSDRETRPRSIGWSFWHPRCRSTTRRRLANDSARRSRTCPPIGRRSTAPAHPELDSFPPAETRRSSPHESAGQPGHTPRSAKSCTRSARSPRGLADRNPRPPSCRTTPSSPRSTSPRARPTSCSGSSWRSATRPASCRASAEGGRQKAEGRRHDERMQTSRGSGSFCLLSSAFCLLSKFVA